MWREFKAFLLTANVLALALAVVIGNALGKVVSALVADIIMPIVAVAAPGGAWREWVWHTGPFNFALGDFVGVVVDFIIIGFVVWRISKAFVKKPEDKPVRSCPRCRLGVDPAATRCPHCTSELSPTA